MVTALILLSSTLVWQIISRLMVRRVNVLSQHAAMSPEVPEIVTNNVGAEEARLIVWRKVWLCRSQVTMVASLLAETAMLNSGHRAREETELV